MNNLDNMQTNNNEFKFFYIFRDIFRTGFHNDDLTIMYNKIMHQFPTEIEKQLTQSFIDKDNRVYNIIPYDKFKEYIHNLNLIYYRDDTIQLKEQILSQTQDKSQINTINRIINKKQFKPTHVSLSTVRNDNMGSYKMNYNNNDKYMSKNCPHCNQKCTRMSDTSYVICGYPSGGYDHKGCGKDWCFNCGKILCKMWNIHGLFNPANQKHDNKCCKEHAKKMEFDYLNDYCHCKNRFINRNSSMY